MIKLNRNLKKRIFIPDIFYNSSDVTKFINVMMVSGKKMISRKLVYNTFNYILKKTNKDPLYVFSVAIDNVSPMADVKIKRVAGGTQNFLVEIRNSKRISISMKIIKKAALLRPENFMYLRLGNEIIDSFYKRNKTFKKKNNNKKVFNSNNSYLKSKSNDTNKIL